MGPVADGSSLAGGLLFAAGLAAAACGTDGSEAGEIMYMSVAHTPWQVVVAPASGGDARPLAATERKEGDPQPRPGARAVATVAEVEAITDLWLTDLTSGERRRLTDREGVDRWPDWSPDGSRLALARRVGRNWDIYVTAGRGGELINLTATAGTNESIPDWSPSGEHIAFIHDGRGGRDIDLIAPDGSGRRPLTRGEGLNDRPVWSPAGDDIAFVSTRGESGAAARRPDGADRAVTRDVYVASISGEAPVNASASPGDDTSPSWSPAGDRLVFASTRDGNSELYVWNRDGGPLSRLTDTPWDETSPSWSPGGESIAYLADSDGDGTWDVWVADSRGTAHRQVAVGAREGWAPVWLWPARKEVAEDD